ncbi:CGNR zinc finger domain-containing protein [Rhodococcus sp. G-MC3]|uniref:CGNR zinc finger domain-containing protein n=1 Tax=Rhodococcus sp. G-MC3 TaxID=3046209 RepID=UPI0024B9F7EC|nr:CGNR zinc finger domain-containing protein [Rhodococcus sp. G-MC3]MDJ0396066.1 CGNR zinc finger domain-containing protein [Rhodococcus sp. G-MC3]
MVFTHDTAGALVAAVDLVNSGEEPDTLLSLEQLAAFFVEQGYTGRFDGDQAELDAVRGLRPALRRLLTSERDDAVDIVNRILADSRALPRLVRHGDTDWHLHAVEDDRPLADRIAVETAMAMIDVIRADELSRLGVCAADCDGIVLDLSRNRSRKFCSTACGNREAVAAYRVRKSER